MGRSIPADNLSYTHPVLLHFSFLAAALAAIIAIITALCGVRSRNRSPSSPTLSDPPEPTVEGTATAAAQETHKKELPLPPALHQPNNSSAPVINMKKATSERRLSFSLSFKMPRSLSVAKSCDPKDDSHGRKKDKFKTEDSVWMKTIILGDKCVPDEEDAVIYEGKGKKISAYHPKNSNSISLSGQTSFVDPAALPDPPNPETKNQ